MGYKYKSKQDFNNAVAEYKNGIAIVNEKLRDYAKKYKEIEHKNNMYVRIVGKALECLKSDKISEISELKERLIYILEDNRYKEWRKKK